MNSKDGTVEKVCQGRQRLFDKPADYAAFEEVLEETLVKQPMRICSYCVMPNHWHLLLWPEFDGDLAPFMHRLTHVTRWQKHRRRVGEGHVCQGRFKSIPVEADDYFYPVARYVERNALRANLVNRAEAWQWSSLWRRKQGTADQRRLLGA
jgi:putative transposase